MYTKCQQFLFLGDAIIGNFFLLFICTSKASCQAHVISEFLKDNSDAKWKNSVLQSEASSWANTLVEPDTQYRQTKVENLHKVLSALRSSGFIYTPL